jgi:hypothetical protein
MSFTSENYQACTNYASTVKYLVTNLRNKLIDTIEILETAQSNSAISKARTNLSAVGLLNSDIKFKTKYALEVCPQIDMRGVVKIEKSTNHLQSAVNDAVLIIYNNDVIFDKYIDKHFILKLKVARDTAGDLANLWNSYLEPESSWASIAMVGPNRPSRRPDSGGRRKRKNTRSKRTHRRRTHRTHRR